MKRILLIAAFAVNVFMLAAKVELPPIFADHMVLQQKSDVAIWGRSEPGKKVVITTTWSKSKVCVITAEDGKWFTRIATPEAGGPYDITFNDGDRVTLKNVLIGEVWICSGQSNMEMSMQGYKAQPTKGSTDLILNAKTSTPIRSCNLDKFKSLEPQEVCPATWYEHTPEAVKVASATAYFFARRLYETLQIPIGIINVSWGGTPIEAWMSPKVLKEKFGEELAYKLGHLDTKQWPQKDAFQAAGVLYNGMLRSVIPYTAKGFIWYQGCNNRFRYERYTRLQPAFAQMLRNEWENQDMGFYFAQIAPYKYDDPDARAAGYMMWAQAQTLAAIPHSGMAATHDVGEYACIHPADKKTVGDRLAYLALANDYGFDMIDPNPPIYKSFVVENAEAHVKFDMGEEGLCPKSMDLAGFELAGEDKVFYPAVARVHSQDRTVIRVWCPEVPNPVAVRYGMRNWSVATVFNCYGIPVSPFRTDNWE